MKMKMTQVAFALLLVTGAMVACSPVGKGTDNGKVKVDRSQEEAALRALDLAWSDAAHRKDIDGVVSYMAVDGETLAPNEPAARDKAAIKASWANLLGLPNVSVHWEPLRVQVSESGEIGYTSGSYTLSYADPKGRTVTDHGKYLEVWKKIDGKWKCSSDAYNSDIPLP
jgi:ketosteroid isomerase-like protein